MGERLVVVVASDGHAARSKRLPLHSAAERAKLVGSLRIVDEVVIGSDPYDLEATLKLTRPDVIALGHDQGFDEGVLAAECRDLKWPVRVDRVDKLPGAKAATRDII